MIYLVAHVAGWDLYGRYDLVHVCCVGFCTMHIYPAQPLIKTGEELDDLYSRQIDHDLSCSKCEIL